MRGGAPSQRASTNSSSDTTWPGRAARTASRHLSFGPPNRTAPAGPETSTGPSTRTRACMGPGSDRCRERVQMSPTDRGGPRPVEASSGRRGQRATRGSRRGPRCRSPGSAARPDRRVAPSTPTTAGSPYSRATTAPWVMVPPTSVTRAAMVTNTGDQLGSVKVVTRTSPGPSSASAMSRTTRARPSTTPPDTASPTRAPSGRPSRRWAPNRASPSEVSTRGGVSVRYPARAS